MTSSANTRDFCDKCFTVVKHEGTPVGSYIDVPDVKEPGKNHKVYTALPEGEYSKDEAVVMCTDIFGLSLVNNLLLADAYATAGLQCYIPDYLNGDPVPQDMKTNPEVAKSFSMPAWRARHTSLQTRPALDACIQYLKEEKKVKKIYAIGYCFGARYVMDLILEGADGKGNDSILSKAAFAHPSQLRVPEDFERLLEIPPSRRIPLLFLTCENDPQFPKEAQSKADEMLEKLNVTTEGNEGNKKMMYKRVYYEGNDHGFAVRGDVSLEHVKKAKEDAFKQAVEWFKCGY